MWGTEERLADLFGADAKVDVVRRHFVFRYQSAEHFFDTFTTYYGPTFKAWGALDDEGRTSFRDQLVALANECNRDTRGALAVPSEYLEVVAHARAERASRPHAIDT